MVEKQADVPQTDTHYEVSMPEPGVLLPAALGGLATGGVYALLAAALALIQGKLRLIDLSHAVGLLLGVFGLTFLILNFGFDPVASLPLAATLGLAGGMAVQRGRAAVVRGGSDPLMRWIALLVIAQFAILQNWGGAFSPWEPRSEAALFGFDFQPVRAMALFIGLLGCGLLAQTLERTEFGRRVRAVPAAAAPAGPSSTARIDAPGFGLACACLAAGACLLVPSNGVQMQTVGGFLPITLALAVLGARGHLRDALSGGLLIGLVEAIGRACLGDGPGLLCVAAIALFLLLGHTEGLWRLRAYLDSEPQRR